METDNKKITFSEKIVNFDFDKYYTKNRRILIHILVWVIYTLIIQIGYHWGYKLNYSTSIFMAVRVSLCNVAVFYLLFYLVIPNTIMKNRLVLFAISIFLLFEIWLIINHYAYLLAFKYGSQFDFGVINETLIRSSKKPLIEVVNPKNVIGYIFDIIAVVSPVLFLKFGFDLSKTYSNSVKAQQKIEKLNYDNLLIENKFLLSQLNPHFLFNTLNNLYALVLKKSDTAPNLILKLSDIIRYTLYEASVKKISIIKESRFIDDYFDMEKMRYPKDYKIEKHIKIENSNLVIEPLLFFVFIENAFKYGLQTDMPLLELNLNVTNNKITFNIQNDRLNLSSNKDYGGIGIKNIKRRLNLLYPGKHVLKIEKSELLFTVNLEINID